MYCTLQKLLSVLIAILLIVTAALPAFAAGTPFDDDAYVSILTASDFQDVGTRAYERFGRMLSKMRDDGLQTPDSMLVGGDYTKVLLDYAAPGIAQIRMQLTAAYPDADPDSVVCIQGNHDNMTPGFAKTGYTDMGAYNLYVINEDDYPWGQLLQPWAEARVRKLTEDLQSRVDALIGAGDVRPLIVLTHLPLHHTSRTGYADNKYASYLFNVLNAAGEKLDVIFLFGHQHSGDYDDYIGGSVNFLRAGDTVRVPLPDRAGPDAYTEETLRFTYVNCGYVGYSDNGTSDGSTNALTLGLIRIGADGIRFVKYTEEGLYDVWDVPHVAPGSDAPARAGAPARMNEALWKLECRFFTAFYTLLNRLLGLVRR